MTIQIEEGKFYMRADGSVHGPARHNQLKDSRSAYPWYVDNRLYTGEGQFYGDQPSAIDLVAEVSASVTDEHAVETVEGAALVEDDGFITRDTPGWAKQVEAEAKDERDPLLRAMTEDDIVRESAIRTFTTGASRDQDASKFDFEGFLSPLALNAFAAYMHKNRTMADGSLRDSDNWQRGIPTDAYMKSMWRHFFDVWANHRGAPIAHEDMTEALCGLLFNAMGYLHEQQKTGAEVNKVKANAD